MAAVTVRVRCHYCGDAIQWHADRNTWTHVQPGHDHAPIPERSRCAG